MESLSNYQFEQVSVPLTQYWLSLSSWWRHQLELFSALVALCERNSPVPSEYQWHGYFPVTRVFDIIFHLRMKNGWLNTRDDGDLRRHGAHYDVTVILLRKKDPDISKNIEN